MSDRPRRRFGAFVPATASAAEVFLSCGTCEPCRTGVYRRCARHGLSDMYGFVPVDRPPGLWGGYAEYQYLAPDSLLVPVGPDLDPVTATLFNPLGAGIRWAVTVPDTQPGDIVAVLGPGVRGLSACAAAKSAGAGFVMVTGKGVRDADPLTAAAEFGADLAVDVEREDPVAALRRVAGALADVVVDVTAKAPAALGQAVRLARGRDDRAGGDAAARPTHPVSTRTSSSTRSYACSARSASTRRPIAAAGSPRGASLSLRGFGAAGRRLRRHPALLRAMAGEGDTPPVHAVFAPTETSAA